jgi:hypothetical protein
VRQKEQHEKKAGDESWKKYDTWIRNTGGKHADEQYIYIGRFTVHTFEKVELQGYLWVHNLDRHKRLLEPKQCNLREWRLAQVPRPSLPLDSKLVAFRYALDWRRDLVKT